MIEPADHAAEALRARWEQVERHFTLALETDPHQRDAVLRERCQDAALRAEVQRLLARHDALVAADDRGTRAFLAAMDVGAAAQLLDDGEGRSDPETIGHYVVERRLGVGATGTVYLAHDPRAQRRVAIKVLARWLNADTHGMHRFQNEARAASSLDHPGIARLFEIDVTAHDELYIVMEYLEGITLRERLASRAIPVPDAIRIAHEIADVLRAAHGSGIVHRDIKPENILLSPRGACLLDFGIAKLDSETLTIPGATLGTAAYMSPEQSRGVGVDHRTDFWSLGVVLYEMLAGSRPFHADRNTALIHSIRVDAHRPVREHRGDVPMRVAALVDRLLEKDAAARPDTAVRIQQLLNETHHPVPEGATGIRRRLRRQRTLMLSALAVPLLLLGAWHDRASSVPAPIVSQRDTAGGTRAPDLPSQGTSLAAPGASGPIAHTSPASQPASGVDAVAYTLYVEGRRAFDQRTPQGLADAARYFRESIARDSSFAKPYAGLADVHAAMQSSSPPERFRLAKPLVARALALDSTLAEAQRTVGWIAMWHDHDWARAERHLKRALELDPGNIWAYHSYAAWLAAVGRTRESLAITRRATAIDPVGAATATHIGLHLFWNRRYAEAIAILEHTLTVDSTWGRTHSVLGRAYLAAGRKRDALRSLRRVGYEYAAFEPEALLTYGLGVAGQTTEARRRVAAMEVRARGTYVHPTDMMIAYIGIGDTTRALDWAERLPEDRGSMFFVIADPIFDPLRPSARFSRVIDRLGLRAYAVRASEDGTPLARAGQ